MELEKAIKLLRERVEIDRSLRDGKVESDYEKFCENECIAIETVLEALQRVKEVLNIIKEEKNIAMNKILTEEYRLAENGAVAQELGYIQAKLENILGE